MRPLDLLMTADAVGGVWTYALDLGGALVARGHRVTLATCGPPPSDGQRRAAAAAGLTLSQLALPLDWLCDGPEPVWAGTRRLAAAAADHDVLLLNSPALGAGERWPVPVIAVAHGDVGTWWRAVRPGTPLDPAFDWLVARIGEGLRAADRVVAPTRAHGREVRDLYGLDRVDIVHNGRAAPTADARPDAEVQALTVGRLWDEAKDVATLNRAAASCAVPIHAAGALDGPGGERAEAGNLRTLGAVAPDRLAALLAARPVFVSTAVFEPFGLAVLEAAQAGCPLVLSDTSGFRELWDGAATFVAPGDAAGFARAVERPVATGAAARERAARYTLDALADGMLALVDAALNPRVAA